MTETYIIWNNERKMWWMPRRRGYTKDYDKSGRYSKEEALEICLDCNKYVKLGECPEEVMVRIE